MTIRLTNGTELTPISVLGARRTVHGTSRDALSFVFPADTSMDEVDNVFTATNCETITLIEEGSEYIYSGYTIRAELKRVPEEVTAETSTEAAVYENRVTVVMAQRTYSETQMMEMRALLDSLIAETQSAE